MSRAKAVRALKNNQNDIVNAIMVSIRCCLVTFGRINAFVSGDNINGQIILRSSVTKQYNLVPVKEVISLAGKVTAGLVESNGNLPLAL